MAEETKPYRLKEGKKHWVGDHEGGRYVDDSEVVNLTERQAAAFSDKFVPAKAVAPSKPADPPPPPPPPAK